LSPPPLFFRRIPAPYLLRIVALERPPHTRLDRFRFKGNGFIPLPHPPRNQPVTYVVVFPRITPPPQCIFSFFVEAVKAALGDTSISLLGRRSPYNFLYHPPKGPPLFSIRRLTPDWKPLSTSLSQAPFPPSSSPLLDSCHGIGPNPPFGYARPFPATRNFSHSFVKSISQRMPLLPLHNTSIFRSFAPT